MILGIYATLGVFLMIASRDPMAHRSLIWFTVWSSIVHGGIMGIQSRDLSEHEPFDFLTWFEYEPAKEAAFNKLAAELPAIEEWKYVEREVDIRLVR